MKIILLEPIGISNPEIDQLKTKFTSLGHSFINYTTKPKNNAEIIERVASADILILSNINISEDVINSCENLKMISVAFTGVDHLPMDLCNKKNILVSNAAGYSNHAVAELTIGSIINLLRRIVWGDNQTRKGLSREGFFGSELHGKTLGIIGLGEIGQQVAKLANVFGCKVIAYNRSKKNIKDVEEVNLETLLKSSDIVSLHVPLTKETKNFIGKEELDLMKSDSIIINTARALVVDNLALKTALKEGLIAGAAIDIYEKEPPLEKNYILFDAPNTLLLPHIGYATKEAIQLRSKIVIDNITKWLNGTPQNIMS